MDYLKVWTSFREVIAPLSDAEKGRLFEAMLLYADTGVEPSEFRGNERFLWPTAKQGIDLAAKKSETNRANGSKPKRTEANVSEVEQIEANRSLNNNINNKVKKDIEKETLLSECKEKEKRFTPPTVEEVRAYCQERGNGIDAQTFVDFYTAKGWKIGKESMKDWKASVRTWESKRKDAPVVKQVVAQTYTQRDYSKEDNEAMLRMLRGAAT